MAANNRIYYAIQQISMGPAGSEVEVHGAQSIGITSNFNLEEIFELGQLALYENSETTPEVEVTAQKVLDGYPLLYQLATETGCTECTGCIATGTDLAGRQVGKTDVYLTIWPDDKLSCGYSGAAALDSPCAELVCSGMYVGSVSYTFPVEGTFTEDVTLVGNNKRWRTPTISGKFTDNEDSPLAPTGVGRRQDLNMELSIFPDDIPGITAQVRSPNDCTGTYVSGGKNNRRSDEDSGADEDSTLAQGHNAHFSNITVSCDFGGREAIFELGSLKPYYRYISFPVEVTCELEVTATVGDCVLVDDSLGAEDEYCPVETGNLCNQKIFIVSCEGTQLDLGSKNKLQSVNYTGGDTGGGNVTITYSYSNFNDLKVAHSSSASFSTV
jgi:hypothetical protein